MSEMTAERFGQRAFDMGIVESEQLDAIWGELGSREVELDKLTSLMVRREVLTNWQMEKLLEGKREGFFYGKYKVLYHVGAGTFARVYRASHRETKRVVAVKVLRNRYCADVPTVDQFNREARTVIPLRHPNIVPIYEVNEMRSRPYMVMDFVEGRNLREFVRIREKLDVKESLRIMLDITAGLDYAEQKGVSHRDLKLSNVLISSRGRAMLADFGLAAIQGTDDKELENAPSARSIDYAGLERITGVRKNDRRSDIYFAGCMLYHMITGASPLFETKERIHRLSAQRYKEIKPVSDYVDNVPSAVVAVINRSMELDPERRYQRPSDMLKELKMVSDRVDMGTAGAIVRSGETTTEKPKKTQQGEQREGVGRSVMLVDPRPDFQEMIRKQLRERGYRVLVMSDPARALRRFDDQNEPHRLADCIIFCAPKLGRPAVDAFNDLGANEQTSKLPAILLVSEQQKSMLRDANTGDHRALVAMPIKMFELRKLLVKLIRHADAKRAEED